MTHQQLDAWAQLTRDTVLRNKRTGERWTVREFSQGGIELAALRDYRTSNDSVRGPFYASDLDYLNQRYEVLS